MRDNDSAADAAARPWHGVVSAEDEEVYERAGFGNKVRLGERPALLVIDMQYRTMGEAPLPILEALKEYATSCGELGWRTVPRVARLIKAFRDLGLPVIFPHVAPKGPNDGGRFAEKVPNVMKVPPRGYEFVTEVSPADGEIRIPKTHPSAFFGTTLLSHLIDLRVDSLVITGCTTSGCVRATAVDAFSYNFPVVVPQDCVYDRTKASHAVSLFDMANKYADVMPSAGVCAWLDGLPGACVEKTIEDAA